MNANYKKLSRYFLLLLFGVILIFYGLIDIATQTEHTEISDEEIIRRAQELGMMELRDLYKSLEEPDKTDLDRNVPAEEDLDTENSENTSKSINESVNESTNENE